MSLSVWILEPCAADADLLRKIWRLTVGPSVRIQCFAKSEALLAAVRKEGLPDLIMGEFFCDVTPGTRLIRSLHRMGPVDVIPVTGDRTSSAFTGAYLSGIFDYLLKPCSLPRLTLCIRRYLSLKAGLSPLRPLSQKAIDRFFFPEELSLFKNGTNPDSAASLSSLSEVRRDRLRQEIALLRAHPEGLSLPALQKALALSETTLRADLALLLRNSLAIQKSVLTHRPGRPVLLYSLPE